MDPSGMDVACIERRDDAQYSSKAAIGPGGDPSDMRCKNELPARLQIPGLAILERQQRWLRIIDLVEWL